MADDIQSVLKPQADPIHESVAHEVVDEFPTDNDFLNWETYLYQDSGLKNEPRDETLGYGIERCLYELNPDLACLSPHLTTRPVRTPTQALLALEEVATHPNRPEFPIDLHLAAFLMSRWKEMSFLDMREMGKPQREIRNLAALRMLASLQENCRIKRVPNLCQWATDLCASRLQEYRNHKVQKSIQKRVAQAIAEGNLRKLVKIFDDKQAINDDLCDFRAAKIEILLIESEIKEIQSKIRNENRKPKGSIGVMGWVRALVYGLAARRSARKGRARIEQLYLKSQTIHDTWGIGLAGVARDRSFLHQENLYQKNGWRHLVANVVVKSVVNPLVNLASSLLGKLKSIMGFSQKTFPHYR